MRFITQQYSRVCQVPGGNALISAGKTVNMVQYNQCSAHIIARKVEYKPAQNTSVHYSAARHSTVQYSMKQCSVVQHSTVKYLLV